ncbi:MAG: hypothetical protein QM541_00365 [Flavobacterium sp.]|nr:hypothetical protein [Flavobacterium sp.]
MDLSSLDILPDWDDVRFIRNRSSEGDEWKTNEADAIAKKMYQQWREVFNLVYAYAANLSTDEEDELTNGITVKSLIYQNIMLIAPKILSASCIDSYVIKMENASIIRNNCKEMMNQVSVAVMLGIADEQHEAVIEEVVIEFRELFKQWVATFKKDDYEDEWGLFL